MVINVLIVLMLGMSGNVSLGEWAWFKAISLSCSEVGKAVLDLR